MTHPVRPYFDQPGVHDVYRRWHAVLAEYDGDRMMIGEAWVPDAESMARYVRADEMQQVFNFSWLEAHWSAGSSARSSARRSPPWSRWMPHPPGCCPTTTWSASSPVMETGRKGWRVLGRPRWPSWRCPARRTSTRARSWACPRATSPQPPAPTRPGSAAPASVATAAGSPCPGTVRSRRTGSVPAHTRGCPCQPTGPVSPWTRRAPTPTRRCRSTAARSRCVARSRERSASTPTSRTATTTCWCSPGPGWTEHQAWSAWSTAVGCQPR
jgi:hypothetical protein